MKRKKYTISELKELGFDKTRWTQIGSLINCSECEAIFFNGKPTHEEGCANIKKGSHVRKVTVYKV